MEIKDWINDMVIPFWVGMLVGTFIGIVLMWQYVLWFGVPLS